METISPFQNVEIRVICDEQKKYWRGGGGMRGGASTFLTRPDSRVMKPAALRSRCSSSFSFVQPFNLAAGGATSIHRDTCVIFFLIKLNFKENWNQPTLSFQRQSSSRWRLNVAQSRPSIGQFVHYFPCFPHNCST